MLNMSASLVPPSCWRLTVFLGLVAGTETRRSPASCTRTCCCSSRTWGSTTSTRRWPRWFCRLRSVCCFRRQCHGCNAKGEAGSGRPSSPSTSRKMRSVQTRTSVFYEVFYIPPSFLCSAVCVQVWLMVHHRFDLEAFDGDEGIRRKSGGGGGGGLDRMSRALQIPPSEVFEIITQHRYVGSWNTVLGWSGLWAS